MVFVGVALSGSHLNVRYIAAAAGTEIVHSITINTRVPLTHGATETECQASADRGCLDRSHWREIRLMSKTGPSNDIEQQTNN